MVSRKFSAEFRAEAVELVISSGRPVAQVAPEISVVEGRWATRSGSGKRSTLSLVPPINWQQGRHRADTGPKGQPRPLMSSDRFRG